MIFQRERYPKQLLAKSTFRKGGTKQKLFLYTFNKGRIKCLVPPFLKVEGKI